MPECGAEDVPKASHRGAGDSDHQLLERVPLAHVVNSAVAAVWLLPDAKRQGRILRLSPVWSSHEVWKESLELNGVLGDRA